MIYFTSDTHFFHDKIVQYCYRPFKFTDEMNEVIIERWNSRVTNKDTIYHLGDFYWSRKANRLGIWDILSRLNGNLGSSLFGVGRSVSMRMRHRFDLIRLSCPRFQVC